MSRVRPGEFRPGEARAGAGSCAKRGGAAELNWLGEANEMKQGFLAANDFQANDRGRIDQ